MLIRARNRWEAFGIHLVVSAVLFLLLASVIYFWWYPGLLFQYDGGLEGIKLIASVDFIIGPVLTLMVYKLGKKSLPFDLACIAVLQVACLVGGMWTVWQTRPVAVVYALGAFRSIPYQAFHDYGVEPEQVSLLQGSWPVWVAVEMSPELQVRYGGSLPGMIHNEVFFQADFYVPLRDSLASLQEHGRLPGQITDFPSPREGEIWPSGENVRYFSAGLGAGAGFLAVDVKTAEPAGFVVQIPRDKSLLQRIGHAKVALVQMIDSLLQ